MHLKHIDVVRILGVENMEEKEPPNGPLVDRERLNRTIVPDILPVDIDKLNHADMGDRSGSVTTLRLAVPPPETGQRRALYFVSSSDLLSTSQLGVMNPITASGLGNETKETTAKRRASWIFSLLASGLALPKSPFVQVMVRADQAGESDVAT